MVKRNNMTGASNTRGDRRQMTRMAALAAVAGLAGFGSVGQAATTYTWDDNSGVNHNWNTANNWDLNSGSPVAGDTAQFINSLGTPSPTTVNFAQNESIESLQVADVAVTFNLNSFQLSVGTGSTDSIISDGSNSNTIFNGPGTVSFNNVGGYVAFIGRNRPTPPTSDFSRVTAQGGATVNTTGLVLGGYRGSAILNVTGAGTVWNASGNTDFGLTSSGYVTSYPNPRTQLNITNGGKFNFDLGTYATRDQHVFRAGNFNNNNGLFVVDGAGSQLNLTGGYGSNFRIGGYGSASTTWQVTNGGLFNAPGSDLGLASFAGTGTHSYTISGTGSKMSAATFGVALRGSAAIVAQGTTIVKVGTGGTLEATGFDGGNRSVTIGSRGTVSLQGGTISIPATGEVTLRDTGASIPRATLEGQGTITGGSVRVQSDSIVRPGSAGGTGGSGTGTITVQDGNFVVESASAQLRFDLSTSTGAADKIQVSATGTSATIPGVITYTNVGSGSSSQTIIDFLRADTLSYDGLSSGDVPLNADNLDAILTSAGYTTRVTGSDPTAANQYRYEITPNVSGSLDALRLILGVPPAGPVVATWNVATAGDWTVGSNWTGGNAPNGIDAEATFGAAITADRTVYADTPVTVGKIHFNNSAHLYNITGAASLTMQVSTGFALIDVQSTGTQKINLPLIIASSTNLQVANGGTLKISDPVTVNAGKNLTQVGPGTGQVLYESTINVLTGGSIAFGSSSYAAALTLNGTAKASITAGGNKLMQFDNLNSAGTTNAWTSQVDITNNDLIVHSSSAARVAKVAEITNQLKQGLNATTNSNQALFWTGNGMITSNGWKGGNNYTAVGVTYNDKAAAGLPAGPLYTSFDGQSVGTNDVLVKYTWFGDADLDGKVTSNDYFQIDTGFLAARTGWINGDFDYNGVINSNDYFLIDSAFLVQGSTVLAPAMAASPQALSGVTSVPEPASLGVFAFAAAAAALRTRRRRRS